jgi:hypothetical protein
VANGSSLSTAAQAAQILCAAHEKIHDLLKFVHGGKSRGKAKLEDKGGLEVDLKARYFFCHNY